MDDALRRMTELAQDGYSITIGPPAVGDGITLQVWLGPLNAKQIIQQHELDAAGSDAFLWMLDKIQRDIADLLEGEARGDDDPDR